MKNHSPGFLQLAEEAKIHIQEISPTDALDRILRGDAILIDVREDHEWIEGHAEGAIHLGRGIIERDIENTIPNLSQPIICYCGGGFRSAMVVDNLQKMGYQRVLSLKGGWSAWNEAKLPTVK